jgi:hypothetical protein
MAAMLRFGLGLSVLLTTVAAGASQAETVMPGAYEVEVRLEMPNLAWSAVSTTTICLPAPDGRPPLPVLSANNPLARCPAENLRREGAMLRFDIICEGRNAARARATYDLFPERFEGRIAMTMGGKNMTMTEIQTGRRVGACEPSD